MILERQAEQRLDEARQELQREQRHAEREHGFGNPQGSVPDEIEVGPR